SSTAAVSLALLVTGAATATATGAAALTSNFSSNAFTNSDSSRRVSSSNADSSSSVLSFAIMVPFVFLLVLGLRGSRFSRVRGGFGQRLGSTAISTALSLGLGAQGLRELRHLGRQRVERAGGARQPGLEAAGHLGQQYLTRFEVGELADVLRVEQPAVEH